MVGKHKTLLLDNEFAERLQEALQATLEDATFEDGDERPIERVIGPAGGLKSVETFEEALMMTQDKGLVLKFRDGSWAQLTITAATPYPKDV